MVATAHPGASERVSRICDDHHQTRDLRLALIDEIRTTVPFEAYSWLLTDPDTEVGCSPLADVPCLSELPRLIRLKYQTPVNRWTSLGARAARLRAATGDQPEQSLVWRDLLVRYGVKDVASVVFRDRFGCWAFLELWRIESGSEFTDDEEAFLSGITARITRALRRCQAHALEVTPSPTGHRGPAVLMLSPDLDVRAQTAETDQYLRALVPPEADRQPIPAGAYNVAAQLLAGESGIDQHAPSARVHMSAGTWLTLRAARLGGPGKVDEADIAVTIESTSPTERVAVFERAFGLTAREAELLRHVVSGANTDQIAQEMFLSAHTVQDHLKSIFNKTATRNRRTLLARATGR